MNPDTSSFGEDEAAALEEQLRSIPQPGLPPAWRDPILRAARTPAWPWMTRSVKWGLAASWAAIAFLHLSMPAGPDPLPAGAKLSSPPSRLPDDPDAPWLAGLEEPVPDEPLSP